MDARSSWKTVLLLLTLLPPSSDRPAAATVSDEPPPRTSLSDSRTHFTMPDKPYVALGRGPVEAVVVDNRAVDDDVLPGHRAGYHGLGSLKQEKQRRNVFVPCYAGLNFEHIHDGTVQDNKILFEPRPAPMQLRVVNEHTAEIYQAPTPHWGLESCLRYQLIMRALYRLITDPGNLSGMRAEVRPAVKPLLTWAEGAQSNSSLNRPSSNLAADDKLGRNDRAHPGPLPQERESPTASAGPETIAWRTIAPFFQPPPEFAGRFGAYRSPLLFDDGTPVRSAADWPRRREEILKQWTGLLGPWPPLIERPKLEVLAEAHRDNFVQRHVRLEIVPAQTGDGWLLAPDGRGPFPAVLVVDYEPETSVGLSTNALRDFGYQLARRGFVTLNIGTPGGNAWKPETGAAQCQPLSFHAYVAANCWHALANLPEVDRARIGVVGHSYGGKWALFAAALWDKFACVAVSDPGIVFDETRPNVNYWEPWYLGFDPAQKRSRAGIPTADNPRTGPYRKMIETGRDLHELHALIAPRPFLVSGGSEDPPERWVALNHTVAVNQLLGFTNRVALTHRQNHTPTEESNAQLYVFFEHFLKNTGRNRAGEPELSPR